MKRIRRGDHHAVDLLRPQHLRRIRVGCGDAVLCGKCLDAHRVDIGRGNDHAAFDLFEPVGMRIGHAAGADDGETYGTATNNRFGRRR